LAWRSPPEGCSATALRRYSRDLRIPVAVALGIPAGVWMGQKLSARLAFLPMTNFFRISLLWLDAIRHSLVRSRDAAAMFLIFLSVFFPVVLATMAAVGTIPLVYFHVARTTDCADSRNSPRDASGYHASVITTLRVTAGVAWLVDVAAEMIAGRDGLGFAVMDARNGLRTDLLVVEMIVIGIIGVLIDRLLVQLTNVPVCAGVMRDRRPPL